MDQNNQGRRPHYHRGRRGPDRRGQDRRAHQPQTAGEGASREPARDSSPDVEQIMREIRTRISQRHGIEFTPQQIHELAARRLEAILDPRSVKPALLEQLRKGAAALPDEPAPSPAYAFEDSTIYETHRGILRFIRRLLNPILKLFFNPQPIGQALNTQARLNAEAQARDGERDRRQAEWNALHYDLLQRLVTENARLSLEMQALTQRVESLGTKVDFNERRVRGLEAAPTSVRPPQQPRPVTDVAQPAATGAVEPPATTSESGGEANRRRRRRRRGRRSGSGAPDAVTAGTDSATELEDGDTTDAEEGADEDLAGSVEPTLTSADTQTELPIEAPVAVEAPVQPEPHPPFPPAPLPPPEPAAVTMEGAADESPVAAASHAEPAPMPSAPPDDPGSIPAAAVDPGPPDR